MTNGSCGCCFLLYAHIVSFHCGTVHKNSGNSFVTVGIVAANFMWEQCGAVVVAQPTSCERAILRCARVANACVNVANELAVLSIKISYAIVLLKRSHCACVIYFYAACMVTLCSANFLNCLQSAI